MGVAFPTLTLSATLTETSNSPLKLEVEDHQKYATKELRRGATRELLQTGNNLRVIKGSVAWIGSRYKRYVAIDFDKTLGVSRLIVSMVGNSSSGGPNDSRRGENAYARAKSDKRFSTRAKVPPRPQRRPKRNMYRWVWLLWVF